MSTGNMTVKYVHEDFTHNLQSPNIIVSYLVEQFKPRSVVDIGCGLGTFLRVFKELGIKDVVGVDGDWVDRGKLFIDADEFRKADLEAPIHLDRVFDLVLCLEVAEHLSEGSADTIVDSLTRLGKTIIFSAATLRQGGQNHINEQPFSYWKAKFEARGYTIVDLFRPVFWNEEKVQWWYKQNMFLVVHHSIDKGQFQQKEFTSGNLLIHPDLYYERLEEYDRKCAELHKLRTGDGGNINLYIGLLLKKLTARKRHEKR
jgi:SAM-dependent methyltransferase